MFISVDVGPCSWEALSKYLNARVHSGGISSSQAKIPFIITHQTMALLLNTKPLLRGKAAHSTSGLHTFSLSESIAFGGETRAS